MSKNCMPTIVTFPVMPPLGVAVELCQHFVTSQLDIVAFWLKTHEAHNGRQFWRTAVMRECLPSVDDNLIFEAVGERL